MFSTTLALFLLSVAASPQNVPEKPAQTEQEAIARVTKRAEALLAVLRSGQWTKAAPFVANDSETRRDMKIKANATPATIAKRVGAWFQRLYGSIRPGAIVNVRLVGPNRDFAVVSYFHDDVDGFQMRLVNGEWYYTLDWPGREPSPDRR